MWCRYRRRAGSRPSVKTARISRPSPLGDPSGLGHGLVDHNLRLVLKKGKMWDPSFNRFANTDSRLWTRTCSRVPMNWLKFRRNKFDSLSRPFHTCGTNCPSNLSSSGTVLPCCAPSGPSSSPIMSLCMPQDGEFGHRLNPNFEMPRKKRDSNMKPGAVGPEKGPKAG